MWHSFSGIVDIDIIKERKYIAHHYHHHKQERNKVWTWPFAWTRQYLDLRLLSLISWHKCIKHLKHTLLFLHLLLFSYIILNKYMCISGECSFKSMYKVGNFLIIHYSILIFNECFEVVMFSKVISFIIIFFFQFAISIMLRKVQIF